MGLLIHRLLTLLNMEDSESTHYHIAITLLTHYDQISTSSIASIAQLCNVSKSTMSKFARLIGFEDYHDLKDSAPFVENKFGFELNYVTNILTTIEREGLDAHFDAVIQDIQSYRNSFNLAPIDELACDLLRYEKVAAFGLLFSESAAIDLQYRLAYNQKFIVTYQSDVKQELYIRNAKEDTLIIVFSNSGDFIKKYQLVEGDCNKKIFQESKAKITLITSNPEMLHNPSVDNCILFDHKTTVQTHSYMFQLVSDIIVHRYRYYKHLKKSGLMEKRNQK